MCRERWADLSGKLPVSLIISISCLHDTFKLMLVKTFQYCCLWSTFKICIHMWAHWSTNLLITKTLICLCSAGIYLVFVFQKMSWCCAHLLLFVSLFFSSYLCFCCFKSFLIRNDCFVCKLNKTSVKLFCVLFFWIMEKSVYFSGLQDSYNKQNLQPFNANRLLYCSSTYVDG